MELGSKNTPKDLKEAHDVFSATHDFKPGDLVQWKPGMKNRRVPDYGQPGVVVALHPGRTRTDAPAGSPLYNEPLDIQLGMFDDDNDFAVWSYDSRRFEPYAG